MIKTRIVEVIPQADNVPPKENLLGYTYLPEPLMERKVPVPNDKGQMPPPIMIEIAGIRYFVIGFTYDIPEMGTDAIPSNSVYVLIVQKAQAPSSIIKVGAGALDQVKAIIPAPGSKAN